ncbi:hypothetical protein DY000_02025316 [Brassica cretica]|uniref:Cytochrome P450 n=1 Tax=Brassica cretica TaxID=69181 RepID=A0ABQ7E0I7_BRACR|nr:hypothetical protein DY000_02025316 [Brassica cretica]
MSISLYLVGSLILALVFIIFPRLVKSNSKLPPSPPKLPIIGNLHELRAVPKYGPVMHLKLGAIPTVVVSTPETARQALKVFDLNCCSRPPLAGSGKLSYDYRDIAFSPYNEYWKEVRKLAVQQLLSNRQVNSIQPIEEEEVKNLMDSLANAASQNNPVNLGDKLLAFTVSVVCRASFGVVFQETVLNNDNFNKLIREALEILGSFSASNFFPYVGWFYDWLTGLQGRREEVVRDLDAFYEQMINTHRQEKKEGSEDFVGMLLRLSKEEAVLGNDKLTRNHIKAILMINGYTIQPKTHLHVNVWAIGLDPDTWKDPEIFLPERFMDSNIDAKGQNFELLTFGSGRRMCPGMYMGTSMVEFCLANMLYHFDWKLPEGMSVEDVDMEEAPGLTLTMKNGLLLVPMKFFNH